MQARLIFIGLLFTLVGCAVHGTCYRVAQTFDGRVSYYWVETRPTTRHGICAAMYGGANRWAVEKPIGINTATHMSLRSDITIYPDRAHAEAYAESVCPSNSKEWHVEKRQ